MSDPTDPVLVGIQLDRAEDAGLIDTAVAAHLRGLVAEAGRAAAWVELARPLVRAANIAGASVRAGDIVERRADELLYPIESPAAWDRTVHPAGISRAAVPEGGRVQLIFRIGQAAPAVPDAYRPLDVDAMLREHMARPGPPPLP